MRLLVVSDLYPPVSYGGYERECATVVEHLAARHDVLVLTSDRGAADVPAQDRVRRELPSTWGARRRDVATAPLAAARAARRTRAALEDFAPDVVYAFGMQTAPHATLAVAGASGVPLACRFGVPAASAVHTGDRFMRYLAPGGRGGVPAALARLANRAPALRLDAARPLRMAIAWASDALRERLPPSPAVAPVLERRIWPATDTAAGLAELPRAQPGARPLLAYVGRVVPEKGPEVAVRALAALRDEHDIDADLVLAGWCEDAMRRRIETLASELGLAGRVTVRGQLEAGELAQVYLAADTVLVPSLVWEALGLVCVEAALARAPIVASDVGGIPEAVRHEREALLVSPGDASACAAAVAATLRRPDATAVRVRAAFERARTEFSVERYVQATEDFLHDAVAAFA